MIEIARVAAFYFGFALATLVWATVSVLIGWALPYRLRFDFIIGVWARAVLAWLRLCCGIRVDLAGAEHIPQKPCVVLARHESTWETIYLQRLFRPQTTLIKRELLRIPFFGWGFAIMKPIAIDRGAPRQALKTLVEAGRSRLAEGIWVLLFPEGTRMAPGEVGKFHGGGAALAAAAQTPLLVVAHNAGDHWPAHRLRKRPGAIKVRIAPPIATAGRSSKDLNAEAQDRMAELMAGLQAPGAGQEMP